MIKGCYRKFSEIFSLTGAGFSYSSYQHPRRDKAAYSNRFTNAYPLPREAKFVCMICNIVLFIF